jgi:hypothetical protein
MQVVYRRCAGLDVHKDSITPTILVFAEGAARQVRTKEFRTHWKELQRLAVLAQFTCRMCRHGVHRCVLETGLERSGEDHQTGAG